VGVLRAVHTGCFVFTAKKTVKQGLQQLTSYRHSVTQRFCAIYRYAVGFSGPFAREKLLEREPLPHVAVPRAENILGLPAGPRDSLFIVLESASAFAVLSDTGLTNIMQPFRCQSSLQAAYRTTQHPCTLKPAGLAEVFLGGRNVWCSKSIRSGSSRARRTLSLMASHLMLYTSLNGVA
jgi:hypothetical protein